MGTAESSNGNRYAAANGNAYKNTGAAGRKRVPATMHMVGEAAAGAGTRIAAAHRHSVAGAATPAAPVVAGVHGSPVRVAGAAAVVAAGGVATKRLVLGISAGLSSQPAGPLVAFATEEGLIIKPGVAHSFYGYYLRRLDSQGPAANGGAKPYAVNGKMTGGFAYVAYPAKYDESGVKTFIINQMAWSLRKTLARTLRI